MIKCRVCKEELIYCGEDEDFVRWGCVNRYCTNWEIGIYIKKYQSHKYDNNLDHKTDK